MFKFNLFKRKKDINEQDVDIVGEDIRREGGSLVMSEEAIDWERAEGQEVYRDLEEEDAPMPYHAPQDTEDSNDVTIEEGYDETSSRRELLDNVAQHNLDGHGKQVKDHLMEIHNEISEETIETIEVIMENTQGSENFMYDFIQNVEEAGIKLMYLVALEFLTEEDLAEYHRNKSENLMDKQREVTSYEQEIIDQYQEQLKREQQAVEQEMVQDYVTRTGGVQGKAQLLDEEETDDTNLQEGLVQRMPEPPTVLSRYERRRQQEQLQGQEQEQEQEPVTNLDELEDDEDFDAIYGTKKPKVDWLTVEIDMSEKEDYEPEEHYDLQEVSEAERVNLTVGEWLEFSEDVTAEIPEEILMEPITPDEEQEQFEKERIDEERRAYIATLNLGEGLPTGHDTEDDFAELSEDEIEELYQQGTQLSPEEMEQEKTRYVANLRHDIMQMTEQEEKEETGDGKGLTSLLEGLKQIKNPTLPKQNDPNITQSPEQEPPKVQVNEADLIDIAQEEQLEEMELELEITLTDIDDLYGNDEQVPQDIYSEKTEEEMEAIREELEQTKAELYLENLELEKEKAVEKEKKELEEYVPPKGTTEIVTELEEYVPIEEKTKKVVTDLEEYKYPTEAEKRFKEQQSMTQNEEQTLPQTEVKAVTPYMPKLKSDYVAGNIDKVQAEERPTAKDVETILEETVREVKKDRQSELKPQNVYYVYDGELPHKMGKYTLIPVYSLAELILYETNSENLLVITNKIPASLRKDLGKWLKGAKSGIIYKRVVTLRSYSISDSLIQREIDLTEKSIDQYYMDYPKNQFDEEKIRNQRASILDYLKNENM